MLALTLLDWPTLGLAILGGYLLGSIPFGLVLVRLAGLGDIREIGSGNIGATNVLRTGRRDLALATFLLDAGKAGGAALLAGALAPHIGPIAAYAAGGAAFLGHLYPVWLGFKGGKGVATFFGTLIAVAPAVGLLAGASWIAAAALSRISSVGALTATIVAPLLAAFLPTALQWPFGGGALLAGLCVFLGILIWWRHRANIGRLLKGEEPRIGSGKSKPAAEAPA
jgi:glycerol-3-phosphate acyltransferase PlsY